MDSYIKLIIQLGICWIVLIAILGVLRSPHGELCPTDGSAGIYYSIQCSVVIGNCRGWLLIVSEIISFNKNRCLRCVR